MSLIFYAELSVKMEIHFNCSTSNCSCILYSFVWKHGDRDFTVAWNSNLTSKETSSTLVKSCIQCSVFAFGVLYIWALGHNMPDKDTFSKRETSLWTLLPAHHKTVRLLWCGGGLFLEGLKAERSRLEPTSTPAADGVLLFLTVYSFCSSSISWLLWRAAEVVHFHPRLCFRQVLGGKKCVLLMISRGMKELWHYCWLWRNIHVFCCLDTAKIC